MPRTCLALALTPALLACSGELTQGEGPTDAGARGPDARTDSARLADASTGPDAAPGPDARPALDAPPPPPPGTCPDGQRGCLDWTTAESLANNFRYIHWVGTWGGAAQETWQVRMTNTGPNVKYLMYAESQKITRVTSWAHASASDVIVAINGDFSEGTPYGCGSSPSSVFPAGVAKNGGNVWTRGGDEKRLSFFAANLAPGSNWLYRWYRSQSLADADIPGRLALGGQPQLVWNAANMAPEPGGSYCNMMGTLCNRHPRTAIGVSQCTSPPGVTNHIEDCAFTYFVVVDGRRPGAAGMTSVELANYMLHKVGASHAFNLDGGGSTSMYVKGKTSHCSGSYNHVNYCSDGVERCHMNGIGAAFVP